ncbi:substrate-binding domain-containing protein [Franzmannia qiaohouensis]|uniref:Substrate-binding domain-containing protein n=1 Tax=Franzmannia qiaohouensis TaxID=1329370 RepID=A0ABU1HBT1_9GAMM|nr:substrate-binding domain-containing protein [Halomonas qiaohouensis]MDR5904927.1 substrate-binding domain-containing protein [Halomonas qiaohouensis]
MKHLLRNVAVTLTALFVGTAAHADEDRYITVASTTSTEASGLFEHIVPMFREETGIDVRVVAVGTGQAFEIGRRGDADIVLVHDTTGEEEFVTNGYGRERRDIMYNDFILVGPSEDPAALRESDSALDAFSRIAEAEHPFTSRGDDSGTNRAELRLWEEAGVDPSGQWYRELGSGMGETLNTAAGMDAYTYVDRATWIAFDNRQNLELVYEGDPVMFNQYGSLPLSQERHPDLKHDMAEEWHQWLLSDEGQAAIASYELRGEQLFFPNAE